TGESDFATAGCRNIEVGLANEQRAEFRFAQSAKELRELAMRDIIFECFRIMAVHLHRDVCSVISVHTVFIAAHFRRGLPSTRSAMAANSCFDQLRRASFTRASASALPSFALKARSTGTRTWA